MIHKYNSQTFFKDLKAIITSDRLIVFGQNAQNPTSFIFANLGDDIANKEASEFVYYLETDII
jgi:hypothetical protein